MASSKRTRQGGCNGNRNERRIGRLNPLYLPPTYCDHGSMTYSDEDYQRLQKAGKRHLWMHFSRHGTYADHDIPIITKGDGMYIWDAKGKKYLDGLAGLFVVQAGHGR